jgi:hypothetical protein
MLRRIQEIPQRNADGAVGRPRKGLWQADAKGPKAEKMM